MTTFRKITHTTFAVEHNGVYLGECKRRNGGRYWFATGLFAPIGDAAAYRSISNITSTDLGNLSSSMKAIREWLEANSHLIREH